MKQSHLGLFIMASSIIIWFLAISTLFNYITKVLHPDHGFGEPIWVIDPVGFLIISVPLGITFFVGLVMVFDTMISEREQEIDRSP